MKRFLYKNIFPFAGSFLIRFFYKTYRIRIVNEDIEHDVLEKGQRPIYISWHQRFFPGIIFLSKRKPIAIIISPSRDGNLIAKITESFGWHIIRGSSSRGGAKAYRQVMELVKNNYSLGHIVDGPRGPFGEIKPGLIMLAGRLSLPILPVIISAEKKWTFNSWDKFIVPKPFSRVIIKFEPALYIPKHVEKDEYEKERLALEDKLYEYYREADEYWEG